MNTKKLGRVRVAVMASGYVLASTLAVPSYAYALGADILIPNPAEFIPALIAFLIIWLILAKLAGPAIMKILDAREKKITDDLDAAENARVAAAENLQQSKDRITAAESKAADIIAAAKREGEEERGKIIAEAQASAVSIVAKAHDAIDAERKKAMIELSGQVVDLSVEIASKIIGDALDDEEQHQLAEKYLLEVGSLNDE